MSAPDLTTQTLFNVKGKVALVTGGGSGLGSMMAAALVQNGAKVYIASRKEAQLKQVSDALNKKGPGSCEYVVADLSTKAGCDALAEKIKQKERKLHVLVNNSGASWGAKYDEVPEQQGWDKIMALNVKSIFYLTVALTELLAKDTSNIDPGRVLNIASVAGISPRGENSMLAGEDHGLWSYNASKAAALHLTSVLAVTLAPRFITVNALAPGMFPSKMTAFGYQVGGDGIEQAHPMGRSGTPEDIAGCLLFLTSRASAHVTGAHLVLDGGMVLVGPPLGVRSQSKL